MSNLKEPPTILTLEEVAIMLKMKKSYVYRIWKSWKGVRVLQHKCNATPRFYLTDILRMMEKPK